MKRALITGGRGGIGSAIARQLEANGIEVLVTTSSFTKESYFWNMQDSNSTQELIEQLKSTSIDYFIHCAHCFSPASLIPQVKAQDLIQSLTANIEQTYELTRFLARKMNRARQGKILFIGSYLARRPAPGKVIYITEKMALQGMLSAFQAEFKNIQCHILHPGLVDTPQVRDRISESVKNLVGDLISPEQVAEKVFTCLEEDFKEFIIDFSEGQTWNH